MKHYTTYFTDAFANTTEREYRIGDEVTCVPNANRKLPCLYQWYKNNTETASSSATFKPNEPGVYRCLALCTIRNASCKFIAMVISVSDPGKARNLLSYLSTLETEANNVFCMYAWSPKTSSSPKHAKIQLNLNTFGVGFSLVTCHSFKMLKE